MEKDTEKFEVKLKWLGNYRFEARARNFVVSIDQREWEGGEGKGFKPTELLLSALAGCFATNLVKVLKFRGVDFSNLSVRATIEDRRNAILEVSIDCKSNSELKEVVEVAEEICKISSILKEGCNVTVCLL
jgi:putative redox protein